MSKTYPVEGLKELQQNLAAIGGRLEKNAYKAGLTAAAAVIRDEARIRAPKKTGKMAKAIRSSRPTDNRDGTISVQVRLEGNDHAFLGLFFEYGVAPHFISAGDNNMSARLTTRMGSKEGIDVVSRKGGKNEPEVLKIGNNYVTGAVHHPGISARPFLRPALDAKADDAVKAFRDRIVDYIAGKSGFNVLAA